MNTPLSRGRRTVWTGRFPPGRNDSRKSWNDRRRRSEKNRNSLRKKGAKQQERRQSARQRSRQSWMKKPAGRRKKKRQSGPGRKKKRQGKKPGRKQRRQRKEAGTPIKAPEGQAPDPREAAPARNIRDLRERNGAAGQRAIPYRRRSRSRTKRWGATESAGCRTGSTPRPSVFMTSTTSWHRTRTRAPSLRTGATSSITLTARSASSSPLSTTGPTWRNMRTSSGSSRRGTPLMMSVWNMPRCSATSSPRATTGSCAPSTLPLPSRPTGSWRQGPGLNGSRRTSSTTSRSSAYRLTL